MRVTHGWTPEQITRLSKCIGLEYNPERGVTYIRKALAETLKEIVSTNSPDILKILVSPVDQVFIEQRASSAVAVILDYQNPPKQLPYNGPPALAQTPLLTESPVKTFRTFLTVDGLPPVYTGDVGGDNSNLADRPDAQISFYVHNQMTKCKLNKIIMLANLSDQIKYGNPASNWADSFFSDPSTDPWSILYISNSGVNYQADISGYNTSYPGNVLAQWATGTQLDAIADSVTAQQVDFTYNADGFGTTSSYPYIPHNVNEIHWTIDVSKKGVILSNQDTIRLVAAKTTSAGGLAQLQRLYCALEMEVIPENFGQDQFRQTLTIAIQIP